jgi:thiol-disulfide isomerase/thioredoxin
MNTSLVKKSLAVLAALAPALLLQLSSATAGGKLKAGDPFPDLAGFQLEGQLPEPAKNRIVLVDFWASWCGPCKASFPVMDELYKKYSKDGLVIIAVNLDDKRELMDDFLRKHPVTFPVVRDAGKKLVGAVSISSMPSSFVLDDHGKILSVHNGFHGEETRKQYVQEIEQLLKSKPATN